MTDQQDTHQDVTDHQTPQAPSPQHKHPLTRLVTFCTFLIACAALALAAYLYQNNIQQQATRNAMQKQLLAAEQKTTEINTQLKTQLRAQAQTLKNITHNQQLRYQADNAEALFLIHMAHWEWMFTKNRDRTLLLLTSAQRALSHQTTSTKNATLLAALQEDIQTIKQQTPDHTNQIIQSIQTLTHDLNSIDVKPQHIQPTPQQNTPQPSINTGTTDSNWWDKFKTGLFRLKDYVRIQHTTTPTEPYLSVGAQQALISHILLQLSQAQWAAINNNNTLYHQSLKTATLLWNRLPTHQQLPAITTALSQLSEQVVPSSPYQLKSFQILSHSQNEATS